MSTALPGPDVLALVRVHADRLHDAVRRLGCGPERAVDVVRTASLDCVEALYARPETVGDPVGWMFARGRALARTATDGADEQAPVGGGVLGTDANQLRLAEALDSLPERQRFALLLRDSYDLPAEAVGAALALDAEGAMAVVGAARLAFLPRFLGNDGPQLGQHPIDLGALARLGEGRAPARDATVRRHAQSCGTCSTVVDLQERARRLLRGMTVVALPDAAREALLERVEASTSRLLPAADLEPDLLDDLEPRRLIPLSLIALGLLLAVGAGSAAGAYASRDTAVGTVVSGTGPPLVTAAPVLTLAPAQRPATTPGPSLTPRVFLITPSPTPVVTTPPPPATPTATATPVVPEPLTLTLSPVSGPNGTTITVTGRGWAPGGVVTLVYRGLTGQASGPGGRASVDGQGHFTATVVATDATPGRHALEATDATTTTSATFLQTP